MKVVTLYTKPGCHLCELAGQVIAQVGRRRRFRLEMRNILEDARDLEKYREAIPVVLVDGLEIARLRVTGHDLEAALGRE